MISGVGLSFSPVESRFDLRPPFKKGRLKSSANTTMPNPAKIMLNFVTTAEFFALWRAVGELSTDPAAGLKIATQINVGNRPPSTMAAHYARDYRDALTRLARFKQLCAPEELQIKVTKEECGSSLCGSTRKKKRRRC